MSKMEDKGMSIFLDVFRRADKNDDGKISWDEFLAFWADGVMGKEELETLFNEIDSHNTGHIDTDELCAYFSEHLGPFKEVYGVLEDLNQRITTVLVSTSQSYPQSSRTEKFIARFLLRELINQLSSVEKPLDAAADVLDQQSRQERNDITPVEVDQISKKQGGSVIPGRVVRRAKRQISSQSASSDADTITGSNDDWQLTVLEVLSWIACKKHSGVDIDLCVLYHSGMANVQLTEQLERLTTLVDRLEHKINFEGFVDEELNAEDNKLVTLLQRNMTLKEGEDESFKSTMTNYIETANAVDGCLNLSVRKVKDQNLYTLYEMWTSKDKMQSFSETDASKNFVQCLESILESSSVEKSVDIPASWWHRNY